MNFQKITIISEHRFLQEKIIRNKVHTGLKVQNKKVSDEFKKFVGNFRVNLSSRIDGTFLKEFR